MFLDHRVKLSGHQFVLGTSRVLPINVSIASSSRGHHVDQYRFKAFLKGKNGKEIHTLLPIRSR